MRYQQSLQDQTVEEHYHGTNLTCNIATSQDLCNDKNCGICGISRNGFDLQCVRKNIKFQRFGRGFYLAPNSSKCHDYTRKYCSCRAMLLCHVCPGNKYYLKENNVTLRSPPNGFDSVYGETGRKLNYEEIVLYNPDAILPRYIIVYDIGLPLHKHINGTARYNRGTASRTVSYMTGATAGSAGGTVRSTGVMIKSTSGAPRYSSGTRIGYSGIASLRYTSGTVARSTGVTASQTARYT